MLAYDARTMRAPSSLLPVALFATLLAACTTQPISLLDGDGGSDTTNGSGAAGGGGSGSASTSGSGASSGTESGSGGAPVQPASFAITAAPAELELRSTQTVNVSVAPNGYVGDVALSIGAAPTDVQAQLGASTVALDGSTTETVSLTLTTLSSTQTGAFVVTVVGTAPEGTKSGDGVVQILPVITITIPLDLESFEQTPGNPNTTAFGDFPTTIKALPNMSGENPITVKFFNADTVGHEIHADDPGAGFGHGNQSIPPNSFDPVVRMINQPGEYLYYPHDLGLGIIGQINIE